MQPPSLLQRLRNMSVVYDGQQEDIRYRMGVSILRANSLKTTIRRVDLRGQSRRRDHTKKVETYRN